MEEKFHRSIGIVEADIEDNCRLHGVRGILEHNDILKMLAEYDDDDKQARAWGKFQHLTGLIYKTFSRAIHVIEPFAINPRDFVVFEAFDTHPRVPEAVLWMAINSRGQKFLVDELFFEGDAEQVSFQIKNKTSGFRIGDRIIEPAAFIQDKRSGWCMASELAKKELIYRPATKDVINGITRVKQALRYQLQYGRFIRPPEIFIFKNCTRTIWEFEHWQWQEWTSKSQATKDPRGKPVDKNDHMMENLRRLLLEEFLFTPFNESEYKPVVYVSNQEDPYRPSNQPAPSVEHTGYSDPVTNSVNDDPY